GGKIAARAQGHRLRASTATPPPLPAALPPALLRGPRWRRSRRPPLTTRPALITTSTHTRTLASTRCAPAWRCCTEDACCELSTSDAEQEMLKDEVRTKSYRTSIYGSKHLFRVPLSCCVCFPLSSADADGQRVRWFLTWAAAPASSRSLQRTRGRGR